MYIAIDNILKKQNKTRYWLSKQTKCSYQSLCKLCGNKSTSITFDLLERICNALECRVEDILVLEKEIGVN